MSTQRRSETSPGSGSDSNEPRGAAVAANRRNMRLTTVDTENMLSKLNALFDDVMSGREYDERQVKNATNLTNTMVKVLRFEFDVYKHFAAGVRPDDFIEHTTTIAAVAEFLRSIGDNIEKANGIGAWTVNGQRCTERELLIRANNARAMRGEAPFELDE